MANTLKPKFKVGDRVKEKNIKNSKTSEIISMFYSSENGFMYSLKSRVYSIHINDMIDGQTVHREDELSLVKE